MQVTAKLVSSTVVEFAIAGWDDRSTPDGEPSFALQLLIEPYAMLRDLVADELGVDDDEAQERLAAMPQRAVLDRLCALDEGGDDAAFCAAADEVISACTYHDGTLRVVTRDPELTRYLVPGWSWESAAYVKVPASAAPTSHVEVASPRPAGDAAHALLLPARHASLLAEFQLTIVERAEDRVRLRYQWVDPDACIVNDPIEVWCLGIGALIERSDDEPPWVTACRHVRGLAIKEADGAALDDFDLAIQRSGDGPAFVELSLRVHDAAALDRLEIGSTHEVFITDAVPAVLRLTGIEGGKSHEVAIDLMGDLTIRTTPSGGAPRVKTQSFPKRLDGAIARARAVRDLVAKGYRAIEREAR